MDNANDLLTTEELAQKLKLSTRTLYRLMAKDSDFPVIKISHKTRRYDWNEVRTHLVRKQEESTA